MMGLGNGYSSSSSNLSALAQPFSIHHHRSTSTPINNNNTQQQQYDPFSSWSAPVHSLPPSTYHFSSTTPPSTSTTRYHVLPPSGLDDFPDYIYAASDDYPGRHMEYGTNFKQDQLTPLSKTDPHADMEQILRFLPSDSTTSPRNSESMSSNHFSAYQNPFATYINPFTSSAPPMRHSSSSVVIRPPPIIVRQSASSPSTACNGNLSVPVITHFDLTQKSNSEMKENSYHKDILNLYKQGNGQSFASPSVKEFSTPPNTSRSDKTSHVSQFPNVNVSDGLDTVQVVAIAEASSDSTDRHSLGVDSPCWRGVNSSQFSSLYVEDDFSSYYRKNSIDELYDIGHEMQENICSVLDSTRTSVCAGEVDKNQETDYAQNGAVQKVKRNLDAVYPSREPNSSDNAETEGRVSTRSIGVQINKDPNMPRKEPGLPNNWMNDFDMNNSTSKFFIGKLDTGLTLSDVSDGNIAVHAAEKVLASPSSQEDTTEGTLLHLDPKKDVTMIIEAMRSLSESLLLHPPNDFCTLEEKNTESLKLIINNLSSCTSRKISKPTNVPNLNYPIGDDSKFGESCDKITISDKPHKTSETKDSYNDRDYWSIYNELENSDVSAKKAEKSPVFSPSRDDSGIRGDDMAEAIKKVLDENLNLDDEMHPQALLFKNLWLEAEAKLCSISYRVRFDQMKRQIEKSKPKTPLGNGDIAEVMAKNHISRKAHDGAGIKPVLGSSSLPRTSSHAGDVETSFLSRLSILKSRDGDIKMDKEKQKSEIADADGGDFVMVRLKILKSRADNSISLNVEEEKLPEIGSGGQDCLGTGVRDQPEHAAKSDVAPQPHLHGTGNHSEGTFGYGNKSLKDLNSCMANDQMIHPLYDARMINQPCSGWHGSSSSSDWEHVLKDDFAWKNS